MLSQHSLIIHFRRSGVGAPVVGEVTGDYYYDQKKSMLDWQLPVIDASNSQGSLEFTMAGHPDDFYPINVSFYSQKTICKLQVSYIFQFLCHQGIINNFDFTVTKLN